MNGIKLNGAADNSLNKLQDTALAPMDEALFQAWAKANQIKKPDLPNDVVDYRGIYKQTGGLILPNGTLKRMADRVNDQYRLERTLRDRAAEHLSNLTKQKVGELDAAAQSRESVNQPGAGTPAPPGFDPLG